MNYGMSNWKNHNAFSNAPPTAYLEGIKEKQERYQNAGKKKKIALPIFFMIHLPLGISSGIKENQEYNLKGAEGMITIIKVFFFFSFLNSSNKS